MPVRVQIGAEHPPLPRGRQALRGLQALHALLRRDDGAGADAELPERLRALDAARPRLHQDGRLHHADEQLPAFPVKQKVAVELRAGPPARVGLYHDPLAVQRQAAEPHPGGDDEEHQVRAAAHLLIPGAHHAEVLLAGLLHQAQDGAELQPVVRPHRVHRDAHGARVLRHLRFVHGRRTSVPTYLRSTSGTVTLPSAFWHCSTMAGNTRLVARPEALSVCT